MLSFNCSHAPLRHFPTDSFVRHILLGIRQQLLHKFKLPLKWTPCLCTFKLCNCIFQKWIRCVVIKFHFLYSLFHLITKCVKLRSSRSRMFFKVGVLKNFANFTGNTCVGMSFNKVAKPLWLFLMKFAKVLRKPFFIEHLRCLLLETDKNEWKLIYFEKC